MKVLIAPAARADLVQIAAFIGRDSPARATQFVALLQRQCEALRQNFSATPFLGTQKMIQ